MSKLNGSWKITVHTYKDAGNGAVAPIVNGVVTGNKYEYDLTIKTPVGEMTNHLVGELGDDDVIRGTSSNPMGSFDFDATRGEF